MTAMIGTLLNAGGIIAGGLAGLLTRKGLSASNEAFFKVLLGAFAVFYGLRLTWLSLEGPVMVVLKRLAIAVLALILGKLIGRLLRLQALSNRIGRSAAERISSLPPDRPVRSAEGFKICAALFCAAPLGFIGAVLDAFPLPGQPGPNGGPNPLLAGGYWYPLLIKAIMEGLATMGFARMFGWGVMLAALPVLAWQGSITLACSQFIEPWLRQYGLSAALEAVGGLLVFSVALVILQLKRIELADYLPSLALAPLIAWLWR